VVLAEREHVETKLVSGARVASVSSSRSSAAPGRPVSGSAARSLSEMIPSSTGQRTWIASLPVVLARQRGERLGRLGELVGRLDGDAQRPVREQRAEALEVLGVGAAMTMVRPGPSPAAPVGEAMRAPSLSAAS
jgi:hypothetical protein